MLRLARIALVVAVLATTVAGFALAEALKLTPAPIRFARVEGSLGPGCGCARIRLGLRDGDRLRLDVVDADGRAVRTLVRGRHLREGLARFVWDGRGADGAVVSPGAYRLRARLDRARLTILLPDAIRVGATR